MIKWMHPAGYLTKYAFIIIMSSYDDPTENGHASCELTAIFKELFAKNATAAAIGFASIPANDPHDITFRAVNRMAVVAENCIWFKINNEQFDTGLTS
jgi:hypothetical protein